MQAKRVTSLPSIKPICNGEEKGLWRNTVAGPIEQLTGMEKGWYPIPHNPLVNKPFSSLVLPDVLLWRKGQ